VPGTLESWKQHARRTSEREALGLLDSLSLLACKEGLVALGVAPVAPMELARKAMGQRLAAGMSPGHHFTYKDPEAATDPSRLLEGAASLVVAAMAYPSPVGVSTGPVASYATEDRYGAMREKLQVLAEPLREKGHEVRIVLDSSELVDREAARLAGIGAYGKNAMLIVSGTGGCSSLIGTLVTDAVLPPGRLLPKEVGQGEAPSVGGCAPCGRCARCLGSCPTGALVAPGVLDATRCLAWMLQAKGSFPFEFREALGGRVYGCDTCVAVCPLEAKAIRKRQKDGLDGSVDGESAHESLDWLCWLTTAPAAEVLKATAHFYVPGNKVRYVRRNALVALGNVADPQDARVQAALGMALESPDSLVRAHAVWACARLGLTNLVREKLSEESDPEVLEELSRMEEVSSRFEQVFS
jgi:epoxyqueuosine reductase